jgi:A/G-specific adenine glycosylase
MKCGECPASGFCFAFRQDRQAEFPMSPRRAPATERRFMAFVARKQNHFLVRQRPAGAVNAHLWEFPNAEIGLKDERDGKDIQDATIRILDDQPLCRVRHSITRYRILLEAYRAQATGKTPGAWKTIPQLKRLPFTSAHRKILAVLARDVKLLNREAYLPRTRNPRDSA